jgi:carbamate kinase
MSPRRKGRVVIGVGGNSLITGAGRQSIAHQYEAVEDTVSNIIDADELGWNIVLTHGNGPQVGFVLERSELAAPDVITIPIDYAVADIQGAVGYMFGRAFDNEYSRRNIDKRAVAVITRVVVDTADKAFEYPSKPIGPFFDEVTAKKKAQNFGWDVKEDSGRGWRRVVASPKPLEILELDQILELIERDHTVIACGGGGIPVNRSKSGKFEGVEAVIDKDLSSSLLATKLGADVLLLSTCVPKVAINFGASDQQWLDSLTIKEAEKLQKDDQFDAGSMGPKVEAILWFLRNGGKRGIITDPKNIAESLLGNGGTQFIGT